MSTENTKTNVKSNVKYDLNRFHIFLEKFKRSEYWKSMEQTVEDSPWHREANVAVHTEMSMAEATKWFEGKSARHKVLTLLGILFHDTGKPPMEVVKENEARGVYRSYANHEQRSARIFEAYVVDHWNEFDGWIDVGDVYTVAWIIEHHLPYGVKDQKKIDKFLTSLKALPYEEDVEIFFNHLLGDSHGRISENWETNTLAVRTWVDDMRTQLATFEVRQKEFAPAREMYLLVGPPGVGKSTVRAELLEKAAEVGLSVGVFSLDDLRLEFAQSRFADQFRAEMNGKARYSMAFHLCNSEEAEAEFRVFTDQRLSKVVNNNQIVVIDNTNTSVKQRRKYVTIAEQKKMRTVAMYFPSSYALLLMRNQSRGDKMLPLSALDALFYSVSLPTKGGEVDDLYIMTSVFE